MFSFSPFKKMWNKDKSFIKLSVFGRCSMKLFTCCLQVWESYFATKLLCNIASVNALLLLQFDSSSLQNPIKCFLIPTHLGYWLLKLFQSEMPFSRAIYRAARNSNTMEHGVISIITPTTKKKHSDQAMDDRWPSICLLRNFNYSHNERLPKLPLGGTFELLRKCWGRYRIGSGVLIRAGIR